MRNSYTVKYVRYSYNPSSFNQTGPFTVYAPTDEAFNNLPPSVMKKLQNDDNWRLLHDLTSYHLTKGNLSFLKWSNNMITPTLLDGTSIRLNIYNNNSGEVGLIDDMHSGS